MIEDFNKELREKWGDICIEAEKKLGLLSKSEAKRDACQLELDLEGKKEQAKQSCCGGCH